MLEINISLLFIAVLVWLLMHFLNAFLFKPVLNVMKQRRQLTEGVKNEAAHVIQEAQQLLAEYQKKIDTAKNEAYALAKQQKNEFMQQKFDALQKARNEANLLIEKALQEINASLKSAMAIAEKEAEHMAIMIAQQIIQKKSTDNASKTF